MQQTGNRKNILVIGNEIAVQIVFGSLGLLYNIVPYARAQPQGSPFADWSDDAVQSYIQKSSGNYDAIIVDLLESTAAKAVKLAGYTKPVIGLVAFDGDKVSNADENAILRIGKDTLKTTLDGILQQS